MVPCAGRSSAAQSPTISCSPSHLKCWLELECTVGEKFHQTTSSTPSTTHRPPPCRDTRSTTGPIRKISVTASGSRKRRACRRCRNTSRRRWASPKIAFRRTYHCLSPTVQQSCRRTQLPTLVVTNVKADHRLSSASSKNGAFHRVAGPGHQLK